MAAIYSLYIISKSGGLIFYKDYGSAGRMDTNDSLRVASLWHSMHAISQQLSPLSGCSGIELLQADTFDLHCFQSLTGTFFFFFFLSNGYGKVKVQDYGSAGRMDTNDSLRVASLWHSMHAISQQLSPLSGCSGIELLQADTFDLHCFQSLTGTFFFLKLVC
ncbi:Sybindin-like protein [Trema orientale]|uniref:Trafficking protein particle complex subunit n=1 Tax=Trema orientale TaxID=63057 RepID=A0A2P5CZU6_TREOI|nr:Sybindin-like protein [Trema orientale]